MNGIMVDNWFMDEVLFSIPDESKCCSEAYAYLLEAIVLWDQVYYPHNSRSGWSRNDTPLKNLLIPIDDWKEEGNEDAIKAFALNEELTQKHQQLLLTPLSSPIVGAGALRYVALSAKHGLDYLPCSSRQGYLRHHLSTKEFSGMLSQLRAQGYVDSLISDQISDIFQPFLDSFDFLIDTPALTQYIIDCTPPCMTPAEFAFHLREEGPTIRYRQYLKDLSNAFRSEDITELGYLQAMSKEVVSDVLTMGKGKLRGAHFKLFPNFSFSVSTGIGELGISISPTGISGTWGITEKTFRRKNLTFLADIARCAAKNSRIK